MPSSSIEIAESFIASLGRAERFGEPFPHFFAKGLFPPSVADELASLPFEVDGTPASGGERLSGKREDRNACRRFLDAAAMRRFPVLGDVAAALQSRPVAEAISALCHAALRGTFLRVEYAVDTEGFWLEPHTDLGVKKFTCLISLADDKNQSSLGTDIYSIDSTLYKRVPFIRNAALIFVPADNTWHGFARRPMPGCRKSLILNYVGADWRDRGQLAFPAAPVL